jgi:hypothetical protein
LVLPEIYVLTANAKTSQTPLANIPKAYQWTVYFLIYGNFNSYTASEVTTNIERLEKDVKGSSTGLVRVKCTTIKMAGASATI